MASLSGLLPVLPGALWRSRRQLRFSLDVLRYGVCDGCSLGAHGLSDARDRGLHLCPLRLRELQRWICGAFEVAGLPDVSHLRLLDAQALQKLGRIPSPLLRRAGDDRFRVIQWRDADKLVAARLLDSSQRWSLWVDPRSTSNEGYFVLRRLAEDLQARSCSLVVPPGYKRCQEAFSQCFGLAASTASLTDLETADLILVCGDPGPSHPLLSGWLDEAKTGGAQLLRLAGSASLVDVREELCAPGRERHFLAALLKAVEEDGGWEERLHGQLAGSDELSAEIGAWQWPELEASSGVSRDLVESVAKQLSVAERFVVVVGEDFATCDEGRALLHALFALVLSVGAVGRPGSGILGFGGGSAGQGAQDCGMSLAARVVAEDLAGDRSIYAVGGGLADALGPALAEPGLLAPVGMRVHQAHFLDPSMLMDSQEFTLVLPMQSRYEQLGGATVTSVDRWIRFSPEVRGHPVGEARPDWQIPAEVVARSGDTFSDHWAWPQASAVRGVMDGLLPHYQGLVELHAPSHALQWGGATLHCDGFPTEDGLAHVDISELR